MSEILTFELGNKAFVTDPCYGRGTWCHGTIETKPGKWYTTIEQSDCDSWGERVKTLLCWHSNYDQSFAELAQTELPFEVGVDSGQAGIFCDSIYPATKKEQGKYGNLDTFYGKACHVTTESSFGIVDDKGVCASSGLGDGSYSAYGHFENDKCIALRIEFLADYDDDTSCESPEELLDDCPEDTD